MKKVLFLAVLSLLLLLPATNVYGVNTRNYQYHYDFWLLDIDSVPAFQLTRTLNESNSFAPIPVQGFDDVAVGGGRLFFADAQGGRVNVLDENYEWLTSIRLMRDAERNIIITEDGEQVLLEGPEGVFFHEGFNELYVADTPTNRLLVLDGDDYHLKRVIGRPDNMTGVTGFSPSKVVVDNAGRIYIIVQGGFEGIVELTPEGEFSRYFGVGRPVVNLVDFFWRMIATNEQRAVMARTFAPSFNNVAIDPSGFVYATTYDSSSLFMVYRLNAKGENVLMEPADIGGVVGDWFFEGGRFMPTSQFLAISVNDYGVYAALDQANNRVFVYNFEGELMSVINHPDGMAGGFRQPSGIAWHGDNLIVTDRGLRAALVFELTEFGSYAFGAQRDYYNGNWESSARQLERAIELNSNYNLAFAGIGRFYLMEEDYDQAMYYLKLGQDRLYYSRAFNHWRNNWLQRNFWWIALLLVSGLAWIVYTEVRYHKRLKDEGGN